ncbi:hypothetical protein BUZ14_04245 [Staphylococcus gallinarum]|uniref:Uncharacterized protein n=1 Tax=Staphylococcus gallinarum TaxID=1293 RepID=A0A3A0VSN6_STAGA|nr:hypothetical protein [Staphylococcus gallinarum]RIP35869.1 hypothetical protein BUZ14_04245 [Staphylococcus gallinarum]
MNNAYLMNNKVYKEIISKYNRMIDEVKGSRLKRIESSYVLEEIQPKIDELKREIRIFVTNIQDNLEVDKEKVKEKFYTRDIDINAERYKNEVEQSKIKLMNKKELINHIKGLNEENVTPQILSAVQDRYNQLNFNDVVLEMRIGELKPFALNPYMRDKQYLNLVEAERYIDNIERDLLNGVLHLEDGTTSNIQNDMYQWATKDHHSDPKAVFKTKESWEVFI